MGLLRSFATALLVTAAIAPLGCGSDPEPTASAAVAEQQPAEKPAPVTRKNTPPVIDRVRFEPEEPVTGRSLRAVVEAQDADGDDLAFEYHWRIDGRDAGDLAEGQELDLSHARKGQSITFEVVASDGRDQSRPYEKRADIENRPPEILSVDLEPAREVVRGTPVAVFSSGSDPDGDPVSYEYHWSVNGRELREDGAQLETDRLRRGDEIRVRVVAYDDEDESEAMEPAPVVVVNGAPLVVSTPPGDLPGGVFRYQVVAEDPDGDPHLEYRLEGAPSGMQIDTYSGMVTWTPAPEQAGTYSVTVLAEDLHHGVGKQVFEVRVSSPAGGQGAAPADLAP
jgi:hypothetical protein